MTPALTTTPSAHQGTTTYPWHLLEHATQCFQDHHTFQYYRLNITKIQQNKDNTSGDESTTDTEHTVTAPSTRTCPVPPPRPSKATNIKQTSANQWKQPTQAHPETAPLRKSPLLPTLPAQTFIPRPSTFNNSRNTTIPRPSTFNNSRKTTLPRPSPFITRPSPIYNNFHQQPYTSWPFNYQQIPLLPLPSHQVPAFTGPYPQIPGHLTQQVYYIPVVLPYPPQYYTA